MDELEQIVQRMIDAGESEDNIAAVIREYNANPPQSERGFFGQAWDRLKQMGSGLSSLGQAVNLPYQVGKGAYDLVTGNKPSVPLYDMAKGAIGTSRREFDEGLDIGGFEGGMRSLAALIPGAPLNQTADDIIGGNYGGAAVDLLSTAIPLRVPAVAALGERGLAKAGQAVNTAAGAVERHGLSPSEWTKAGAGAVRRATTPGRPLGFDARMPNRPAAGTNVAANDNLVPYVDDGVDRYMANEPASSLRALDDEVFSFEPEVTRNDYIPARTRMTEELNAQDAITDAADREWMQANPPTMRSRPTNGERVHIPEVVDDAALAEQRRWRGALDSMRVIDEPRMAVSHGSVSDLSRIPQGRTPTALDDFVDDVAEESIDLDSLAESQPAIRGFLPAMGETSITSQGRTRMLRPESRDIDLANEIARQRVPGARVTRVNQPLAPPGTDEAARALRQRRHIEDSMRTRSNRR